MTLALLLSSVALFQATPVVFNNSAPTGLFHDISAGAVLFDEGRIPSTTAPEAGSQNTYSISQIELGYTTRALDVASGGPGARMVLAFYAQGDATMPPSERGQPLAELDITGLPGSATAGTLETHVVTYPLPAPVLSLIHI